MSGIRKIIAGLINPKEYLQKNMQEENIQNGQLNTGFSNAAKNIGEQLGGNIKTGLEITPGLNTADKGQNINNTQQINNLADNSANRVLNQPQNQVVQNNAAIISQTPKHENTVNNIPKNAENTVAPKGETMSRLDQILADDNPTVAQNKNTSTVQNQTVQPANNIPQSTQAQTAQPQNIQQQSQIIQNTLNPQTINNATQNIVNNEMMSQAVSYQVSNNTVKDITKNVDPNIGKTGAIQNNEVNPANNGNQIINNNPAKQEQQSSFVSNESRTANIASASTQSSKTNNISQTIYNQQYQAIMNDADKNVQQNKNNAADNFRYVQQNSQNNTNNVVNNAVNNASANKAADVIQQEIQPSTIQNKPVMPPVTNEKQDFAQRQDITTRPTPVIQPQIKEKPDNAKIQQSIERSVQVKELLGLPKTLGEILFVAQNKNAPINSNTLLLNNLNQNILQNQKVLSEIFDDAPEMIQVNPAVNNAVPIVQNIPMAAPENDAITLIFSGMVRMPEISALILKNSKEVISQLMAAMETAETKQTMSRIKDTLGVINSCIAMADTGNPAQTLKSLMLLYLPWLPLNEGIGFDLEVDTPDGEIESNASKLTVLIQTRNFGNVKGVFTLTTSNSVDAYIICNDGFPKKTLLMSLNKESEAHSMSTNIDIESVTPIKREENSSQEAKVNLSATNEMNPYLLLIAHSFIRNTISIDTEAEFAMAANSPS